MGVPIALRKSLAGPRSGFAKECRPLVWLALERRVKEPIGCGPTVVVHGASLSTGRLAIPSVAIIARRSQARAFVHSRLTVIGATPKTSAISSSVRPPKNRSSTICAFLGSRSARSSSASCIATTSPRGSAGVRSAFVTSTNWIIPPSIPLGRRRDMSTSICRIMRADIAKKCDRFCQLTSRQLTRRMNASFTNAVVCNRCPGRSRRTYRCASRRSSASTSGTSWSRAAASPCRHATSSRVTSDRWGTAPDDKVCLEFSP